MVDWAIWHTMEGTGKPNEGEPRQIVGGPAAIMLCERAVRQQALPVYRKSCLTGRTDLAAFFLLEDLSLPAQAETTAHETAAKRSSPAS